MMRKDHPHDYGVSNSMSDQLKGIYSKVKEMKQNNDYYAL